MNNDTPSQRGNLAYRYTNECIEAIMAGMRPFPEDRILAVGGSGDQAFALIEYAKEVVVAEMEPAQMAYIARRKELLESGDYEGFMHLGNPLEEMRPENVDYFLAEGRLDRIRAKLPALVLGEPKPLEEHASEQKFTKIYASNATDGCYRTIPAQELLNALIGGLEPGGLLYLSTPSILKAMGVNSQGIVMMGDLTMRARQVTPGNFQPSVYVKV